MRKRVSDDPRSLLKIAAIICCFSVVQLSFGQKTSPGGDLLLKPAIEQPKAKGKGNHSDLLAGRWEAMDDTQTTPGGLVKKYSFEHNQIIREFYANGNWKTDAEIRGRRIVSSGKLEMINTHKFKTAAHKIENADFDPAVMDGTHEVCTYSFPKNGSLRLVCDFFDKKGALEVTDDMRFVRV